MTVIHIDFETRSNVDLKKTGVHVYAADESTDVWCMAYAIDDGPVELWTPDDLFLPFPESLLNPESLDVQIYAHNAAFELAIWNGCMTRRYGWPALPTHLVHCTMALAYAMALPGSLENAASALGLAMGKDKEGHRLMMQMSGPRRIEKDGTLIWWDDDARKQRLYEYCKQDIVVERELEKRLMKLPAVERELWLLDQEINNRGVYIDLPAVNAAIALVEYEKERLDKEMEIATGGRVAACSQVAELTRWIQEHGIEIDGLAKADVAALLEGTTALPDAVRRALELRREAAKSSTAKLKSMAQAVSADSRVRGIFQYHGASTGRWAGRRIQPQNLPRPTISQKDIEYAIGVMVSLPTKEAAETLNFMYGSAMQTISDCLRGMITAAPGHDLIAADFSAIEARVLAWLAGQDDVLAIFKGHGKIYEHAAAGIYGKRMEDVTKDERQIGKVAVLALGYQGGVGAFQTMARGYGVKITDERADEIKYAYRQSNQHIVRYWYALEDAAKAAVRNPGKIFTAGAQGREVRFKKSGSFLFCRLPSGRCLTYPYARAVEKETKIGFKEVLSYKTTDSLTKKWEESDSYGGLLSENVTQAVARDLLASAMLLLNQRGYIIPPMHVHDEIVCEVPEGFGSVEEMETLITEPPVWAKDCPIAAEGWRGKRYRK